MSSSTKCHSRGRSRLIFLSSTISNSMVVAASWAASAWSSGSWVYSGGSSGSWDGCGVADCDGTGGGSGWLALSNTTLGSNDGSIGCMRGSVSSACLSRLNVVRFLRSWILAHSSCDGGCAGSERHLSSRLNLTHSEHTGTWRSHLILRSLQGPH